MKDRIVTRRAACILVACSLPAAGPVAPAGLGAPAEPVAPAEPAPVAGRERPDIPAWWKETRAFYCPFANSGAGGSLMKYRTGGSLADRLETFRDLPAVLEDARRLGTGVLYLVDYWEPEYEAKGEYVPYRELGGYEALRDGIRRVHELGGRVILYLEAFIISRRTEFGRKVGPAWAMMDELGRYHRYFDTGDRFYLMYPGEGSGWTAHLAALAGRMARELEIDGVHLDSYGLQWGWRDFHPDHPGGRDPESFNRGAVRLVREVRAAMRRHRPEAIAILEGAERTELLDVCDGAQIESLSVLRRKPWWEARRYPIFTSSFELAEMRAILDEGYALALSPWWLDGKVRGRHADRLAARTDKRNRVDQVEALNIYNNLLVANGVAGALPLGITERIERSILEELDRTGWKESFVNADLATAADRARRLVAENEDRLPTSAADAIRALLAAAVPGP